MSDIYDQHSAAFANVSAYVVVGTNDKGEPDRKATIAFKWSLGGTVFAYVHVFGGPMVRGRAGGGGYDKETAAAAHAASKINPKDYSEYRTDVDAIKTALMIDGGAHWDGTLRDAGYVVLQAV